METLRYENITQRKSSFQNNNNKDDLNQDGHHQKQGELTVETWFIVALRIFLPPMTQVFEEIHISGQRKCGGNKAFCISFPLG